MSIVNKCYFYLNTPLFFLFFSGAAFGSLEAESTDGWFPFQPQNDYMESVIGMEDWFSGSAGKHGFLKQVGESLAFEDGTPIKFWGTNLSNNSYFASKEKVDQWVSQFRKYGINAVRFHKFTWDSSDGRDSTELRPEAYERFDYFNDAMRDAGIYFGWSHIYGHRVRPGDREKLLAYDEIANLTYPWAHLNGSTSALVNFAPDLQDLNIELTVNLLNHVNPLTGLRYADDASLAFIELQNEDDIYWSAIERALEQTPTYRKLLCEQFSGWLEERYDTDEAIVSAWGAEDVGENESLEAESFYPHPNHEYFDREYKESVEEGRLMRKRLLDEMRFLFETQLQFYKRFEKAIRETGYRGVIVASCWQAGSGISHFYNLYADAQIGMVDRHNYFGGGTGHRLVPGKVKNRSMLTHPGDGLLNTGFQQVAGRAFALSEWMSLSPNEWIAEGPATVAVYGMGLQGWDASFQFGTNAPIYASTIQNPGVYVVESPTQMGLYPALSRLVLRGDVSEGAVIAHRRVHLPSLAEGKLGFYEVVEQGFDNKLFGGDTPREALAAGKVVVEFTGRFEETVPVELSTFANLEDRTIRSNTDELSWDYSDRGFFTVNTPASKAVVGHAGGRSLELGGLSIEVETPFAVVFFTALEPDADLDRSNRWLLTTVARARNTGMLYNEDKSQLLEVGEAPILLEPVDLSFEVGNRRIKKINILNHDGKRTGRSAPIENRRIRIDGAQSKAIYYEIEFFE